MAEPESLIEYPVEFPIKVMGKNAAGFAQAVTGIVVPAGWKVMVPEVST